MSTRIETFERDNLIVGIIFQHKGKENAISMNELVTVLNESGYTGYDKQIHKIVKGIIFERYLPICSLVGYGYWWGGSKQDIQEAIDGLQAKIDGLQERIDLLKSFIIE